MFKLQVPGCKFQVSDSGFYVVRPNFYLTLFK